MTKRRTAALFKDQPQMIERQQRRLSRQQSKLQKDMENVAQLPVRQRNQININTLKHIDPLTDTQADVFDAFADPDNMAFVLYGSAGTGKTYLATAHGLLDVFNDNVDKLVIIRSICQTKSVGFLPGSLDEKAEPYEAPYIEICADLFGRKDAYEKLKDCGKIEFLTTTTIRGISIKNSFVIFDEVQNSTFAECSSVVTRIGENSKIVICGDGAQNDLIYNKNETSGFRDFISVASRMAEFRTFRFTPDDIVRSSFVKSWIVTCEHLGLS